MIDEYNFILLSLISLKQSQVKKIRQVHQHILTDPDMFFFLTNDPIMFIINKQQRRHALHRLKKIDS